MTIPFLTNIDLNKNELLNAKFQNLATDPAGATKGMTYFNTTINKLKTYNGTAWTTADEYTHPATHPATMITEDSTHRFVSDTDKTNWNAKETTTGAQTKATTAETNAINYAKGFGLGTNAKSIDTIDPNTLTETGFYHTLSSNPNIGNMPSAHSYWIIHMNHANGAFQMAFKYSSSTTVHYRRTVSGVWQPWFEIETTAGAQAKADQAETDAINWAKGYGLGIALPETIGDFNSQQTTGFYYMKSSLNSPTAHPHFMLHVFQFGTGYTVQIAYAYGSGTSFITPYTRQQSGTGTWGSWKKVLTENDLASVQSDANTYTDQKVAALVDSSPTTLDTLNELAAALGDDPNFATTITTELGNKVDKVAGQGLSTNDYTTAEKTKLAGIATGANNYVHPATHPPSIIAQDTSNRFVTDAEKTTWNAKAGKYSASMGNASATSFTITHNLNTQDVIVSIRETASPYNVVYADVEVTTVNTITVKFATAPTTNQYRATVMG